VRDRKTDAIHDLIPQLEKQWKTFQDRMNDAKRNEKDDP
jgi:hypothetical protein